jgi:hypothetical protein
MSDPTPIPTPIGDDVRLPDIAPPGLSHTLYWTLRYQADPEFAHIRFKRLEKGYPNYDFLQEWIDVVPPEVFFANEPDRLPLFIGCQFGCPPVRGVHAALATSPFRIAILGKSLLSGRVAGLRVLEIEWREDSEPNSPYGAWRELRTIRRFSND